MSSRALKAAITAGDGPAAAGVISRAANGDALLDELVRTLTRADTGVPWQLVWRVKRAYLPAALRAVGHVIARFWDRPAIDPIREHAYTLIPPRDWVADPRLRPAFGDRVHVMELARGRSTGLVRVPAGRFSMGRATSDVAGGRRETDTRREVAVTRDYWIGATLVTRSQWAAVLTPGDPGDDDRPAIVGWRDALAFLNAVSRASGLSEAYVVDEADRAGFEGPSATGYRLPTEAEWEMAARAGTTTATYDGDLQNHYGRNAALDAIAWYGSEEGDPAVAQKLPNAFGLYDALGLAWEFVFDRYTHLSDGPLQDPIGDVQPIPPGGDDVRVQKGGSIGNFASLCRASTRLSGDKGAFRICRTASEPRFRSSAARPVDVRPAERPDTFLALPHSRPRRLRTRGGLTFVGTEGGLTAPQLHELIVLDGSGAVLHRWPTRFLVSDLVIADGRVWLALGPGYVDVADDLGAAAPRGLWRFINAPVLATFGDDLVVGETFGQVHVNGRHLGGVKKWLYDLAADKDRIYGAYEDGRCRAFDRGSGAAARKMPSIGRKEVPRIAVAPGVLFVAGPEGTVSRFDTQTLDCLSTFGAHRLARISVQGDRLVVVGPDAVSVYALDGTFVSRWTGMDPSMTPSDALLADDHLIVALAHSERCEGALVRVRPEPA